MASFDPKQYRDKYARFIFDRFEISSEGDDTYIYYYYIANYDNINTNFMHTVKLSNIQLEEENSLIQNIVFNLGLMEMINYYKLIAPKSITLNCGCISAAQSVFWQKLYFLGLGEYRYLNNFCLDIRQEDFVRFSSQSSIGYHPTNIETSGNIIPVGGGKDSSTVLGLLQDEIDNTKCLMVNAYQCALDCAQAAGYTDDDIILVDRIFDNQMIKMNEEGFLNGHVPYSAILAFISLLVSAAMKRKYIILANESSANESTVLGTDINHQYSKTLKFERDFDSYVNKFITPDIKYFSLLRPWAEVKIAETFAKFPKFHSAFLSCNKGLKTNTWCGKCAKCLFVYIILSPYIEESRLQLIFGKNVLDDSELEDTLKELLGYGDVKPFDCVGTISEVEYALRKLLEKYIDNKSDMPYLLKQYNDKYITRSLVTDAILMPSIYHNVPDKFLKYLGIGE